MTEDGRMPWRTSNEEQQRRKFCEAALSRKGSFEQLCKSHGIRRQTGHKWLKRLKEEGYKGLKNRTRRPHRLRGAQRQQEWQERLIALKRRHWTWGPKKLRKVLAKLYGSPEVGTQRSESRTLAGKARLNASTSTKETGTTTATNSADCSPAMQ